MKLRFSVTTWALCSLAVTAAFGQGRDYRAERLVLDDNNGNTIVVQTPAGPITGGTLTVPDPNGAGQFVISNPSGGTQSVSGDFLPGADNTYDLGSGASRWQDIFLGGNATVGGALQLQETGGGTDYVGFQAPAAVAASQVWTLPAADGTSGQVLSTNGAGTLSWATAGGTVTHNATLSGSGTSGSPLTVNLGNANTWTANQTFASPFLITSNARIAMTNSDNNARDLRMQEPSGTGTQYVGFRAPSVSSSSNYVWPASGGTVGQVLSIQTSNYPSSSGSDSMSLAWTTVSGGSATADSTLIGDGSGGSPLGIDLAQSNIWTATISTFAGFLEARNEPLVVTNTDNTANEIRIQEASSNGSNYFAMRADTAISTNDVWIMPSTAGTVGQVLGITAVNTPSNRFYTLDWKTPTAAPAGTRTDVTVGSGNVTLNGAGQSFIRVTSSTGAYSIIGISGGVDGQILIVYNQTTNGMTLSNESGAETTAANRIHTMNGASPATTQEGVAILIYDGGQSRWIDLQLRA